MRTHGILLLAVVLLVSACGTTYNVKVDSLATPTALNKVSYRLANKSQVDTDSLRYKEAERAVKAALAGRGMYEAPEGVKADLTIGVDYGMSEPRQAQIERHEPMYDHISGGSHAEYVPVGRNALGQVVYTVVLVPDPPREVYTGDHVYYEKVTVYEKYLRLSAVENKESGDDKAGGKEVWNVEVTSEGQSNNLRKYLPILAGTMIDYIGKETNGQKTVRIKDNSEDSAPAFVRKGM